MSALIRNACVFCGANEGNEPGFKLAAQALGSGLAQLKVGLVFGGGRVGIMGLIADAALKSGGQVQGVIPQALMDREVAHKSLTRLHVVQTMHERKKLMFDLSDIFLTLPGGFGTLDETFEILTWRQIGIHAKPVVLINIGGYFTPMLEFIDHAVKAGFVKREHRQMFLTVNSAEEALALVAQNIAAQ